MLKSALIRSFRGVKGAKLSNFANINVVFGDNASGKTSIMEAIFLNTASTNASVMVQFSAWRGENRISFPGDGFFRSILPELDKSGVVGIDVVESNGTKRKLEIRGISARSNPSLFQNLGSSVPSDSVVGLHVDFQRGKTRQSAEYAWSQIGGGLGIDLSSIAGRSLQNRELSLKITSGGASEFLGLLEAHFISPPSINTADEVYQNLTSIILSGKESQFNMAISSMSPEIRRVLPLNVEGMNTIMLDKGGKLIPISLVGGGLQKIIRIVAPAIANPGSILFVDEIENGLHYSRFSAVCDQMFSLSRNNGNQVFISTHSLEFIRTISEKISEVGDSIAFYRVVENGVVHRFDQSDFVEAMQSGFDPR